MRLNFIGFAKELLNCSTARRTAFCVSTEYHVLPPQLMFNLMQPLDFELRVLFITSLHVR